MQSRRGKADQRNKENVQLYETIRSRQEATLYLIFSNWQRGKKRPEKPSGENLSI